VALSTSVEEARKREAEVAKMAESFWTLFTHLVMRANRSWEVSMSRSGSSPVGPPNGLADLGPAAGPLAGAGLLPAGLPGRLMGATGSVRSELADE